MTSNQARAILAKTLADLYPLEASIRRVVRDSGLSIGQIEWDARPINSWSSVLMEASHQGKVQHVIEIVLDEYSAYTPLRDAVAVYNAEAPVAATPPWDDRWTYLRDILAGTYWQIDRIEQMIVMAQLRPWLIPQSKVAVDYWKEVLQAARKERRVQNILDLARRDYPQVAAFNMTEDDLLRAVPAPTMRDAAWQGQTDGEKLRVITGVVSTLYDIEWLRKGTEIAKAVARVVLADGGRATGFLVGNNYLVTSHHVLPSQELAATAVAQFRVERALDGGDYRPDPYPLVPGRFWMTSPRDNEGGDDWTVVAVDGNPRAKYGSLFLTRTEPKVKDNVIIVQHPSGGPKKIALSRNFVVFVNDKRIQYLADTQEGSTGSPVFDSEWRIVALHHKGGLLREPGSATMYKRKQGIHVNVLVDALQGTEVLAPAGPA